MLEIIPSYKFNRNFDQYQILALGSSRALQFLANMFAKPFFNLGSTVSSIYQVTELVRARAIKRKILLIGLDQWAFNRNWDGKNDRLSMDTAYSIFQLIVTMQKALDILSLKVFPKFNKKENEIALIGTGANLSMDGMLRDGSYYYGRKFNESINGLDDSIWKNKKFTDIIKRIRIGTSPFQFGNEANTNSISGVEELIQVCKQNGDTVIFFFPPFAPLVSDLVKRSKYGYMNDASSKLSRLCRKYEIPFFDYSYFHSKDEQFVDGIHGGNELYYEILKSFHIGYNEISYINPFECRLDSILTKNRERFFAKPVPRALSVLRG